MPQVQRTTSRPSWPSSGPSSSSPTRGSRPGRAERYRRHNLMLLPPLPQVPTSRRPPSGRVAMRPQIVPEMCCTLLSDDMCMPLSRRELRMSAYPWGRGGKVAASGVLRCLKVGACIARRGLCSRRRHVVLSAQSVRRLLFVACCCSGPLRVSCGVCTQALIDVSGLLPIPTRTCHAPHAQRTGSSEILRAIEHHTHHHPCACVPWRCLGPTWGGMALSPRAAPTPGYSVSMKRTCGVAKMRPSERQ
mmetsp:Transcript_29939/g.95416  ORF Transcript_29939/g.95416 Transcript_29939/m.95416 type:complete len:247 (+) Transcript_29939:566-1306(+)